MDMNEIVITLSVIEYGDDEPPQPYVASYVWRGDVLSDTPIADIEKGLEELLGVVHLERLKASE
jgi:hypothetical protein